MNNLHGLQHRRCGATSLGCNHQHEPNLRHNQPSISEFWHCCRTPHFVWSNLRLIGKALYVSSSIRTLTVGIGISPIQSLSNVLRAAISCLLALRLGVVDYHHRWGISPRPEDCERLLQNNLPLFFTILGLGNLCFALYCYANIVIIFVCTKQKCEGTVATDFLDSSFGRLDIEWSLEGCDNDVVNLVFEFRHIALALNYEIEREDYLRMGVVGNS